MRQLTAKQKKLLTKWYKEYQPVFVDDLNFEHWEMLEKINDTEILWQEVNRFLSDMSMEDVHNRSSLW